MLVSDLNLSDLATHPKMVREAAEKARRQREIAAAAVRVDSDAPWIAARVMTGKELILEKQLTESGIECFVPVRKGAEKRRNHKKIPSEMIPVMNGYVLVRCRIIGEALLGVLGFEHVINLIGGNEKPYLVQTAMVNLINGKAQTGAYDWDARTGFTLSRGMRVRIVEGMFAGAVGEVIQAGRRGDAVIDIQFLGGQVPALIPLAMLEKL